MRNSSAPQRPAEAISSPLSDQSSPSPWTADTTRDNRKIIIWNTPIDSPSMVILVDEQVKQLFRRVLGRSTSSAARSIMAHFPTLSDPSWTAGTHEVMPVQYLLVALKELTVVTPHHPGVRQAVKEAGELVKSEALRYIKIMLRKHVNPDHIASIMAMHSFLALGLHVPTFYPVAKGFLLDFQDDSDGAILLLKGLDGGIYHVQFTFPMFKDVLEFFRHNKVQGIGP